MKKMTLLFLFPLSMIPITGCNSKSNVEINITGNPSMIYKNDDYYVLDNDFIQVKVKKETGYIETIYNKLTKVSHKNSTSGAWPFMIEVGEDRNESSINNNTNNKVSSVSVVSDGNRDILLLTYDELLLDGNNKEKTGIKAVSHISIGKDDEYIKLSVDLDLTNSSEGITRLSFTNGGDLVSGCENERLTAPTWGGGSYWNSPADNKFFNNGVTIGYPGLNTMSLECGWMDIHGSDSGIGIALIDKSEMYSEFDISSNSQIGMEISPTLFRPSLMNLDEFELEKGTIFNSDEVIVAAHSGDWHKMADIYRKEYQEAFTNEDGTKDYLTEEDIKKTKLNNYTSMIRAFCGLDGELVSTFDEMKKTYEEFLTSTNVDPSTVLFWLAGQNPQGYAFDVPFMTPTYALSGGDEGLRDLANHLHKNKSGLFVYEHPFAVDPNQPIINSVLDIITPGGKDNPQHTERWNLCTHYSVCTYNKTMSNIWEKQVLPPIVELGTDGLQFDQASLTQIICDREGHYHTLSACERLSSAIKGTVNVSKMCLSALPEGGFLMSEGFNDLSARYTASGSNAWFNTASLLWGATDYEFGCTQYTHPQYRYVTCGSVTYSKTNSLSVGTILGAVLGTISQPMDASILAKNNYIKFKQEMIEVNAPGYPYGYKDMVGLTLSDDSIIARVFTDGEKITLTYTTFYGSRESKATIDLEKLGFKGKGSVTVTIPQIANDNVGYMIIDPNSNK